MEAKNSDPPLNKTTALHLALGKFGEQRAAEYLTSQGYRIVAINFVMPIGYGLSGRQITGEIDIVAYDERVRPFTLAFIEVKTRTRSDIATPEAAVDIRKQRHIIRAARLYRRLLYIESEPFRYDVVSVLVLPGKKPEISLFCGYFTDQRFARSSWRSQMF